VKKSKTVVVIAISLVGSVTTWTQPGWSQSFSGQAPPSMAAPMNPGPGFGPGMFPVQPQQGQAPTIEEQRVGQLEQRAFGSTYPEHDVDDRVEHLEREVFGRSDEQGEINGRIAKLEAKLGGGGAFGSAPPFRGLSPAGTNGGMPPQYAPPQQPVFVPQQQPAFVPQQQQPVFVPQQQQAVFVPQQQQPAFVPQQQQPAFVPQQQQPVFVPQQQQPAFVAQQQPPAFAPVQQPAFAPQAAVLPPPQMPPAAAPIAAPVRSLAPARQQPVTDDLAQSEFETAVMSIPCEPKAGDYFSTIQRYDGCYARWTGFPVRIHLPMNTPENWRAALEGALRAWARAVPLMVAPSNEPADVEIAWINHLQPRQLGITNLEVFNGHMRVTIYLLRPNFYPPGVKEAMLPTVATHEMGHALGLWGHSPLPSDIMQSLDTVKTKSPTISARDINTLRRVYQSPGLPAGFQSPQPVGWAFTHYAPLRKSFALRSTIHSAERTGVVHDQHNRHPHHYSRPQSRLR
jgi:predicted Zn-dependent protease